MRRADDPGLFGNPAFAVVQNDITGNINVSTPRHRSPLTRRSQKVRTFFLANPVEAATLESLLAHDKAIHPKQKERVATDALMWLLRGLKFTALGLRHNVDIVEEELSVSFTKAYEGSLKKYHGMMVRPVFYVSRARRRSLTPLTLPSSR